MAGRSAPGRTAALFRTDCRSRLWNLYHARLKQERSGAHRGPRSASRQRHSNYGSVGMEPPSRLSTERPHDRGRRAHGGWELLEGRGSYYSEFHVTVEGEAN